MSFWSAEGAAGPSADDASQVLWDVVEEHLDEGEFNVLRFLGALDSPSLKLDHLENVETAIAAHVDGLVLGGQPIADDLLLPVLGDAEAAAPRVITAVLALIAGGRPRPVVDALLGAPCNRSAVERGSALAVSSKLDFLVSRELARSEGSKRASLLRVAGPRLMKVDSVVASLAAEEPGERAAAIRAASLSESAEMPWIEHALGSTEPRVRDAAMLRGLEYGSASAWSVCQTLGLWSEAPHALAMALAAGLGDRRHHERLVELSQSKAHRYSALRALGCSGNLTLVPWLIEQVAADDDSSAKLAAEAVCTISGAPDDLVFAEPKADAVEPGQLKPVEEDAEAMNALPPFEADDLDADLVPPSEAELAKPDALVLRGWWEANRGRFDVSVRHLLGVPLSLLGFRRALERLPLRRRHVIALLLSVRTGRAARIITEALPSVQRRQLASMTGGSSAGWVNQYTSF